MVEGVITGTVLGEALFNALRRLAQQGRDRLADCCPPSRWPAYADPDAQKAEQVANHRPT